MPVSRRNLWVMQPSFWPMRSTRPEDRGRRVSMSISLYLMDELPEFRTNIFMLSNLVFFSVCFLPEKDSLFRRSRGYLSCAWMAVMMIVLRMSSTVQPRERSFTGLFSPWSIGPMAKAPVSRWTAL